ncbi:MAG: hypothetical protein KDA24_10550 [Deltaproteobacteria bacterium]|nr:hypothetical protein [Deltaproteobacteria bacterium]
MSGKSPRPLAASALAVLLLPLVPTHAAAEPACAEFNGMRQQLNCLIVELGTVTDDLADTNAELLATQVELGNTQAVVKAAANTITLLQTELADTGAWVGVLESTMDSRLSTVESTYVTSVALDPYATRAWVTSQNYAGPDAVAGFASQDWVIMQGFLVPADLAPFALNADLAITDGVATANQGDIANLTADVAAMSGVVAATEGTTAMNAMAIADNAADIADNAADIADNAADIADNTADIADNTADIADNTADIADNTADIAAGGSGDACFAEARVPDDLLVSLTTTCATDAYGVTVCDPCAETFVLDGSGTHANGLETYAWALVSGAGTLGASDQMNGTLDISLTPTGPGTTLAESVTVELTATDCDGGSTTAQVTYSLECVAP